MLDITVKTIDGQNRRYSIPDNYLVRQFKEKISTSLNIPIDRQRLIFQGRELKDDRNLSEFDVNGKTIHLVQRTPPSLLYQSRQNDSTRPSTEANANQAETEHMNGIQNLVQQIIGGINDSINPSHNQSNVNVDIHVDVTNMSQNVSEQNIRNRLDSINRLLSMARNRLRRIEEIQSGAPLNDNLPPAATAESATTATPEAQTESQQPNANVNIGVLGGLISDVTGLYSNFQPHLQEYLHLLNNDSLEPQIENNENRRQRFCNNINDMMHLFGHMFHNLSDLHVNLRDRPPRNIRLMVPFQTSIITAAVPISTTIFTSATPPPPAAPSTTTTNNAQPTPAPQQPQGGPLDIEGIANAMMSQHRNQLLNNFSFMNAPGNATAENPATGNTTTTTQNPNSPLNIMNISNGATAGPLAG